MALVEPGTVVDGFTVGEPVHEGGMAVLHRVTREDQEFPLLMKVPRIGPGEPAATIISYEVEAMVMAALQGPAVPRFVAAGDVAVLPYIVMEHVDARPLQEWADRAPLPADEVARLGAALATAVHLLHQQEAIHLDLKPGNVLVRPGGEAVLVDFGLAHHGHFPDLLAEETTRPIGSAPYMSPEQIVGVRSDPRSDVFAIGAILYQLATGRLPFGQPTGEAGLRRRLWRDPVPPRAIARDLPPWLQEIILRCLEVDGRARYPTAAQLALDLVHPDEVAVGERGKRLRQAGPLRVLKRWVKAAGYEPAPIPRPSVQLSQASIVMVAVATGHADEAQLTALREVARRDMAADPAARLAAVTVIRPASELGGSGLDDHATGHRIKELVALRHWAEPLGLPAARVSFHVLESADTAEALLRYARMNAVDHVVIGAPPRAAQMRGMLGSVSSDVSPDAMPEALKFFGSLGTVSTKVAAEAPCTVTIVRPRGPG
ncbi:MAG: bifunctional serine/threonine-protein kinase/universal stress protein [Anaeromyxobacter sp.]